MALNKNGSTVTYSVDPIEKSDHQACVVRKRRAAKNTATRPAASASKPSESPAPVLGTCVSPPATVLVVLLVEVTLPLAAAPDPLVVAAGFTAEPDAVAAGLVPVVLPADPDCGVACAADPLALVGSTVALVLPLAAAVVASGAAVVGAVVGATVGAGFVGTAVGGSVAVAGSVGLGVSVGGTGVIAASCATAVLVA